MSVLFLFVDGFGIGPSNPETNPVARLPLPGFAGLLGGRRPVTDQLPFATPALIARGIDACLGVAGRPRSGTGHVSIMAGLNAAKLIGRHEGPYPGTELRRVLQSGRTLPNLVRRAGRRVAFANAFSPLFHERRTRSKERWSGFGLACDLAGLEIRGIADLQAGRAVSAWPTNHVWVEQGHPVASIEAVEAGARLAHLALDHDLTFYEYFATDFAGHRGDRLLMERAIVELDRVVAGAWPVLCASGGSLLIASDHGNVEDWSSAGHTTNPALFVAAGPVAGSCRQTESLPDIMPALLRYFGVLD